MKQRLISLVVGLFVAAALFAIPASALAGGYSGAGALIQDPDLPVVIAVLLRDGFSEADANAISATLVELLGSAGGAGIDTSDALAFSRADLVSFGLGDADTLDSVLRGTGLMYVSITASVITDPVIGEAIRLDVRAPSLTETVLGSIILPEALVMDPLSFIASLGIDLSGLGL